MLVIHNSYFVKWYCRLKVEKAMGHMCTEDSRFLVLVFQARTKSNVNGQFQAPKFKILISLDTQLVHSSPHITHSPTCLRQL